MYSVCYIINGQRVWTHNKRTHTRYYTTKAAYRAHIATALEAAKAYKENHKSHRVEVEGFYNGKPCFYITVTY